jgi:hypothetical protein
MIHHMGHFLVASPKNFGSKHGTCGAVDTTIIDVEWTIDIGI